MKDISKISSEYVLDSIGLPPVDHDGPEYNIRALDKYWKEHKINPKDLTEDELKQFEL